MQYLGGKSRLAKKFGYILTERLASGGRFIEPFVGGFNLVPVLTPKVPWCSDIHPGLIVLYQALQAGTFDPPEHITEDEYQALRARNDWSNPLSGFAAFGCSFGAIQWGSYARNATGKSYCAVARRSILRKTLHMSGVEFACADYRDAPVQSGDVVYADPPYLNTSVYKGTAPFDHEAFYEWCEACARIGASMFVSEFTIPDRPGWNQVWSIERQTAVDGRTTSREARKRVDFLVEVTVP